jgi:hypothetical protein
MKIMNAPISVMVGNNPDNPVIAGKRSATRNPLLIVNKCLTVLRGLRVKPAMTERREPAMTGIVAFFSLLSFFACTSESVDYGLGEYYVEIATALEKNAFLLDTGKTVRNTNGKTDKSYEPGDRVYLNFSYTENSTSEIIVHSSAKISKGVLKAVKAKEITESMNDPVRFESAWMGSHYLNLQFYIEYKSEAHTIALITDESKVNDSEVKIYFRHTNNNDSPGYPSAVHVSYDLSTVLGEPLGDRTLLIDFSTTNYGNKTYKLNY